MTMKNDSKIEEELTRPIKTDMRSLTNLTRVLKSKKKLCFNELQVTKVYNAQVKTVQRSYLS